MLAVPFVVAHKDNENIQGTAVGVDVHHHKQDDGKLVPIVLVAVLWNDARTPSPSFHAPDELAWLVVGLPEEEDDEEEEEEGEDGEEAPAQSEEGNGSTGGAA